MRLKSIFPLLVLLVFSFGFIVDDIKVTPDFTDEQVKQAEQEAAKWYKNKIEIKVINRDANGKIVNLVFTIYDAEGKPNTYCKSDNFGLLIIRQNGCGIQDKS